ncbi:MAG: aspartyl-phosphate phosphatase Spo0E family protein [Gorillibacterium sp.]|nr:aspartyl-phosphate phosphatase Spo0E family protein [Gorillibacterium sp.]
MDRHETISNQIERERLELYHLVGQYGLPHRKVIAQSLIVDKLINEYNVIKYGKKENSSRLVR